MNAVPAYSHAALLQPRCGLSFRDARFLMFVLDDMAQQYEQEYANVIRLTLGKSELPPGTAVVDAMLSASADYRKASLVFPAGLPELRERLAREYRSRHGADIPARNFVVSTGTSAAFRNLYQLLVGPGDEIVVPLPYYPLYVFSAQLVGARIRYYQVDPLTMRVDLGSLAAVISERTRIVVVNSPGNPLGNVIGREEFLAIDRVVAGRALLLSDEIYNNAQFEGDPYSAVSLVGALSCPLVVSNSFSKGHRMYARRVGYTILPDELVEPMTVVQHHTLLTVDPVPQFGAIAALDNPGGAEELARIYRARRDYTVARFAAVEGVRALRAQGSFYITLDCAAYMERQGIATSLALAERILAAQHVATVPGGDFGLPTCLRLSYSAMRYDEAVDRLVRFFTGANG